MCHFERMWEIYRCNAKWISRVKPRNDYCFIALLELHIQRDVLYLFLKKLDFCSFRNLLVQIFILVIWSHLVHIDIIKYYLSLYKNLVNDMWWNRFNFCLSEYICRSSAYQVYILFCNTWQHVWLWWNHIFLWIQSFLFFTYSMWYSDDPWDNQGIRRYLYRLKHRLWLNN